MRGLADRLADIRAATADILEFVQGLDEAAFAALPDTDRRTYRAIKNALAEIGEAIKQLPPEVLAAHREIDWRGFAGLRPADAPWRARPASGGADDEPMR